MDGLLNPRIEQKAWARAKLTAVFLSLSLAAHPMDVKSMPGGHVASRPGFLLMWGGRESVLYLASCSTSLLFVSGGERASDIF